MQQNPLRNIPSIDSCLTSERGKQLLQNYPRNLVIDILRNRSLAMRQRLLGSTSLPDSSELKELLLQETATELNELYSPHLKKVINATGIILHTNLGRAPLADPAVKAVTEIAGGYCDLELNLSQGKRGDRHDKVKRLLQHLTGCESSLVVNNCAAAVLLIATTLAKGRTVVVSRGELIEIGGSYRLPDVLEASGAVLKEVGTTNRTRITDFESALDEDTALILASHPSNYRIVGFTESPSRNELAALGKRFGIPTCLDLGSGLLDTHGLPALEDEPTVRAMIKAGFDLITFSGDKLLGGPQAGIIVGRQNLIKQLHASPLCRALRVGKLTMAALESTLRLHLDPESATREIPVLSKLKLTEKELSTRASTLLDMLRSIAPDKLCLKLEPGESYLGGGCLPEEKLPTTVVSLAMQSPDSDISIEELGKRLRHGTPPVLTRLHRERLLLDPRTIEECEFPLIAQALRSII